MTLERITVRLSDRSALIIGSPDGTLTFDLPHKAIITLAERGLKQMAEDVCVLAAHSNPRIDALDTLWEKLDAISKD